ncbi:60 kDa chaperonin 3, partial [Chlamydiales bacterium SCGC AG-110-M15]
KEIEKTARTISSRQEIKNIATVSASGNEAVGETIATAMDKVGKAGVITIEESKTTDTNIELVEGMQFDRGYLSPYFCTDAEKMITEMSKTRLLIVDKKISNIQELLPILQALASTREELLIIAEDIEGDALSTLVVNRLRGTLKVAAVKAPGFGDRRKEMLKDIAALTGGRVISEEAGDNLKDVDVTSLGSAEKITITKDNTTIVNGGGSEEDIKVRLQHIEREITDTSSSYDIEKLEERKAKLSSGVAVIRVGAPTEPEMKENKRVFEDSLNSTKAAIAEGVVAGGGVALLNAKKAIEALGLKGEELVGANCVAEACEAPLKQLAENAGMDSAVVLSDVESAEENHGLNLLTEKLEDMFKAGVIDAAKVVKNTLRYAASVAGIIFISEALITDAKDDEEEGK